MAIETSLNGVMQAMDQLRNLFLEEIDKQKQEGRDEADLQRLGRGAEAMRDAGNIYLTWARHYISALSSPDTEEMGISEA